MRRFQKKPEVTFAFIPGVGRLITGQVLEGEQYARFVPSLLVEISAPVEAPSPKVAPPAVINLPAVPGPMPSPPPPGPTAPGPVPSAPRATSMKDAGFPSPEELVAAVDEENKQTQAQIEQAVARLDPVEAPKEEPKKKEAPKPKSGSGKKSSGRK